MVKHVCSRCGWETDRKSNLISHLKRKKPCILIKNELKSDEFVIREKNLDFLKKKNKKTENSSKFSKMRTYLSKNEGENLNLQKKTKKKIKNSKNFQNSKNVFHKKYQCDKCGNRFTRHDNLKRHKNTSCKVVDNQIIGDDLISILKSQIKEELKNEIMKEHPPQVINNVHQNILQVLCVGSNDNYLDMLTNQYGDFNQALKYVKDCALSNLSGDCKLLSKIYFDSAMSEGRYPIKYLDKSRCKVTFINEKNEEVIDNNGLHLGKKLANNLQNTYLKGINYLINKNLEDQMCPNKFLEDYDLQNWNHHIYELSNAKYQKKIIHHLDIPQ